MSTQLIIAVVQALQGFATVKDSQGNTRALQVGDNIYLGDTVQTGDNALITLQYGNQFAQTIGPNASFLADNNALATALAAEDQQMSPDSATLLVSNDVQPNLIPPIFIAPKDEGQHSAFAVAYLAPESLVHSGYPTIGIGAAHAYPLLEPIQLPPTPAELPLPPIQVASVTLTADDQTQTVYEAALDTSKTGSDLGSSSVTGSDPSSPAETVTGTLAVVGATGYVPENLTGTHGLFELNADGTYVYTLITPVTEPSANNGIDTVPGVEVFHYTAHDASGNTVQGTVTINVVDDVPTAVPDTNEVTEGGRVDGNVLTNDIPGADGFAAGGGVVGVAAGSDISTPLIGGLGGAGIVGAYGTLTLNSNGSYSYQADPSAVNADNANDVFAYTIRDGDGDLSSATLTIHLNEADITTNPIASKTVDENAVFIPIDAAAAFNNPGDSPSVEPLTYSMAGAPGWLSIDSSTGVISSNLSGGVAGDEIPATLITVTAQEEDGTMASTSFHLTVNEVALTASPIADQAVGENAAFTAINAAAAFTNPGDSASVEPLTYSMAGAPGWLSIDSSTGVISSNLSGGVAGDEIPATLITVTAQEEDGTMASTSFHLTVNEVALTASPIADQAVGENAAFTAINAATAFTNPGDSASVEPLTYSMAGAPGWLSIDSSTGVISSNLSGGVAGDEIPATLITVTAQEEDGTMASTSFHLTVNEVALTPPSLSDVTVGENQAFTSINAAFTNPGDPSGNAESISIAVAIGPPPSGEPLTYSMAGAPGWLSIDSSTGVISSNLSGGVAGDEIPATLITVTAREEDGTMASTSFHLTVNEVALTASPIADQAVGENAAFTAINAAAAFTNPGDSASVEPLTYSMAGAPGWLSIDSSTGVISSNLSGGVAGDEIPATLITVTAQEEDGTMASTSFHLTVNEVALTASPIADQAVGENAAFTAINAAAAFTNPGDSASVEPLTYSMAGAPGWLSIDSSTGVISSNLSGGVAGDEIPATLITVTAQEEDGTMASTSFHLTVNEVALTASPIADQAVGENAAFTAINAAAAFTNPGDSASVEPLTYSMAGAPGWLSIDSSTGVISSNLSGGVAGDEIPATLITVTAQEEDGTMASTSFHLTVNEVALTASPIADQAVGENAGFTAINAAAAFTNPGDSASVEPLTYSMAGAPGWLSIDSSTGVISSNLSGGVAGDEIPATLITVTAQEEDGTMASTSFHLTVNEVALTASPIADQAVGENAAFTAINAAAAFTNPGDSASVEPLTYSMAGAPGWLSIDSSTGVISSNLSGGVAGDEIPATLITVTAQEEDGTMASTSFHLTVNEVALTPPSLSDVTVGENQAFTSINAAFTNPGDPSGNAESISIAVAIGPPPSGEPLTYSMAGAPGWLSIDSSTGVISSNLSGGVAGDEIPATLITVTAQEEDGTMASTSFHLTVNEVALTASPIADQAVGENAAFTAINAAAAFTNPGDSASVEPLTYSMAGAPGWLSIDSSTGVISSNLSGGVAGDEIPATLITVTAQEEDGTMASTSFHLTVNEVALTASPIADQAVGENAAFTAINAAAAFTNPGDSASVEPLTYSMAGAPGWLSIDSSTGVISSNLSGGVAGDEIPATLITVTAQEEDGTMASTSFHLTVNEVALTASPIADQAVGENAAFTAINAAAAFTNPGDSASVEPLTYSMAGAPGWLSIDSSTGVISSNLSGGVAGDEIPATLITVTAQEEDGTMASTSFHLTVNEVALTASPIADQAVGENAAFTAINAAAAFTNPGDSASVEPLTYSMAGAPGWLSIDSSTGVISSNLSGGVAGDEIPATLITVTAREEDGTMASTSFHLTVNEVALTASPIADQAVGENAAFTAINAAAAFTNPGDSASVEPLTYSMAGAPGWLSIDSSTGVISSNLSGGVAGDEIPATLITVTAQEEDGTMASTSFHLTVNEVALTPPSLSDVTVGENQAFTSINAAFTNPGDPSGNAESISIAVAIGPPPSGEPLTYSMAGAPGWLSIDSSTGVISSNLSGGVAGDEIPATLITVTAQEEDGTMASTSFHLTVNEVALTSSPLNDQTVDEDAAFTPINAAAAFSNPGDPSPVEPLTYSMTGAPDWLSIDPNTGIISSNLPGGVAGEDMQTTSITVTASELDGTSAMQSFDLTVNPISEPPILTVDTTSIIINEETGSALLGIQVATHDSDDGPVSVTITGIPSDESLTNTAGDTLTISGGSITLTQAQLAGLTIHAGEQVGPLTLTVTANTSGPEGGNAVQEMSLTVNPVAENPIFSGLTATSAHEENGVVTLGASVATHDSDDGPIQVTITGLANDLGNFSGGNYTVGVNPGTSTWTGSSTEFNTLTFNTGEDGVQHLSITAQTSGPEGGISTEPYTLTVNPIAEAPILGGATSATATEDSKVTLGVTETKHDSDDTLGTVTITALPHDLSAFNGGTYTAGTGTWTGTAAQFAALSFTAGDEGTYTLSISAPTTGTEAGVATESYNLTVTEANDTPTAAITAVDSSGNGIWSNNETGTLNVQGGFYFSDGFAANTVTVHLVQGFTATTDATGTTILPSTGTLDGYDYTYNSATGVMVFAVPSGTFSAVIDIKAPADVSTLPANIAFTTESKSVEAGGTDVADAQTGIATAHLLTGTFTTNSNVQNQQLVFTFVDPSDPTHAAAYILSANLQGQQGLVSEDAGFNINTAIPYDVSLEAVFGNFKTNVTAMTLSAGGGVADVLIGSGGAGHQELQLGGSSSSETAFTAEMTPNNTTLNQSVTASTEGTTAANTLTAPSIGFHYLYGNDGNDTLNGSSSTAGPALLNGGTGSDTLTGHGSNDVLVYGNENLTTSLSPSGVFSSGTTPIAFTNTDTFNGGSGFSVLRVDWGAVVNTALQANGNPATQQVIDLTGKDSDPLHPHMLNISEILLTQEATPDSSAGTTVKLAAGDVASYTHDSSSTVSPQTLTVVGGSGDHVQVAPTDVANWVHTGAALTITSSFTNSAGQTFNVYTTNTGAHLDVESHVTVVVA